MVAVSRARKALVVVGNRAGYRTSTNAGAREWRKLAHIAKSTSPEVDGLADLFGRLRLPAGNVPE